MSASIELRQLRYFVAVAEELHFGRAADRLHMSQSPLSRAIRELERDLGVVLFVRTTRRVELTAAGSLLLERSRRALAEIDGAVADAQRTGQPDEGALAIGHGPFGRTVVTRIAKVMRAEDAEIGVRFVEDVTPSLLARVGAHDLGTAVVMESPAAARRYGVRIDTLKDEPLLAALPASHRFASEAAVPVSVLAAEPVLLPTEPPGQMFNSWLRALITAHGHELERTIEMMSAPWDHRMLPVANGEAVSVFVEEWVDDAITGVVAVPFDPPLSFPMDLASAWPPTEAVETLVEAACRVRDADDWLTQRPARTQLPSD